MPRIGSSTEMLQVFTCPVMSGEATLKAHLPWTSALGILQARLARASLNMYIYKHLIDINVMELASDAQLGLQWPSCLCFI